jgi:hypothetical protein
MACVINNVSRFNQPGAEDDAVGQLLLEIDIVLQHDPRFIPSVKAACKVTDGMTVHLHRQRPEVMVQHHRLNQPGA